MTFATRKKGQRRTSELMKPVETHGPIISSKLQDSDGGLTKKSLRKHLKSDNGLKKGTTIVKRTTKRTEKGENDPAIAISPKRSVHLENERTAELHQHSFHCAVENRRTCLEQKDLQCLMEPRTTNLAVQQFWLSASNYQLLHHCVQRKSQGEHTRVPLALRNLYR